MNKEKLKEIKETIICNYQENVARWMLEISQESQLWNRLNDFYRSAGSVIMEINKLENNASSVHKKVFENEDYLPERIPF